ncbi:MOSC domain-containing protein [Cladophialophora immunda]|nr:MOSC domain-containing protein [Cladophialophora immunda]
MTIFQDDNLEAVKLLEQPWKAEKLLEVRTGRVRPVFGIQVQSAIFKNVRRGPVAVNQLGCEGDQHAFELHGGPDMALLQYSTLHYRRWKEELPDSAHLFVPGGFGENLVAAHANERNICIGDVIQIGTVVAQVSLPRQPCFKLNHRFQIKDMSKRSQDLFRTGWLYRILKEGKVQAGDDMILLRRPHPEWTIAKVQYYLYHDMRNEMAMRQLIQIKELGLEARTIFENRLKKQYEDQEKRLTGGDAMLMNIWSSYRLVKKQKETPRIVSLTFERTEPSPNPEEVHPGSHVQVKLGDRKLVRAYSVVAGDANRFELAIALSETSRGGSHFIHRNLHLGDTLLFGKITPSFPLSTEADEHVFIAGGIGLTAFIASAARCQQEGLSYHLHYLVRSSHDVALKRYLKSLGPNVTIYDKSAGKAFNAALVMGKVKNNTHIYCCGSDRLRRAIAEAAHSMSVCSGHLHFETFEVATSGDPFVAELADSGGTLSVEGEKTLLDALREAGLEISSSCEAGNCGTCRVGVRSGNVKHRGTGLVEAEKCSAMLSCVSRGIGTIVLDL